MQHTHQLYTPQYHLAKHVHNQDQPVGTLVQWQVHQVMF